MNMDKKIRNLLKDENFRKLVTNPYLMESPAKTTNVFEILGVEKKEIRHSKYLAWLLDPTKQHGIRDLFLRAIVIELGEGNNPDYISEKFSEVKIEVRSEDKRMDIMVRFENALILIENKIGAKDYDGQLSRYRELVESKYSGIAYKKRYVYLTPNGDDPSDKLVTGYNTLSYEKIADILDEILMLNRNVSGHIFDYLSTVRKHVVGLNLSQISLPHREALLLLQDKQNYDAVIEKLKNEGECLALNYIAKHSPDAKNLLLDIIIEMIKEQGWIFTFKSGGSIRFLTKKLYDKQAFCHEGIFCFGES